MINDFQLTSGDKVSGLWLRLKAHMEERLASARVRNDDATQTEASTASLRGEIRTLKWLIKLDSDRPILTGNDE